MDKQYIEKMDEIAAFDQAAAIFAANGIEISKATMHMMSPLLSGEQTLEEHRTSLKEQLKRLEQ